MSIYVEMKFMAVRSYLCFFINHIKSRKTNLAHLPYGDMFCFKIHTRTAAHRFQYFWFLLNYFINLRFLNVSLRNQKIIGF